jgi:hypothetical protein
MMPFEVEDDLQRITFENMSLTLPKQSILESWKLFQKYMIVYLEAHKEDTQAQKTRQEEQEQEQYEEH